MEKYKNLIGITFKKSRFNATPEASKFFEISRWTNLTRLEVPDHVLDWPFPKQWLGLSTFTNLQCISIVEKHNSAYPMLLHHLSNLTKLDPVNHIVIESLTILTKLQSLNFFMKADVSLIGLFDSAKFHDCHLIGC
jgi:hypothetical protein